MDGELSQSDLDPDTFAAGRVAMLRDKDEDRLTGLGGIIAPFLGVSGSGFDFGQPELAPSARNKNITVFI